MAFCQNDFYYYDGKKIYLTPTTGKIVITFNKEATQERKVAILKNSLFKPLIKNAILGEEMTAEFLPSIPENLREQELSNIRKNSAVLTAHFFLSQPGNKIRAGLTNEFIV